MKTKLLHPIARLVLAILMCLPIYGSHAFAQEAESYAVFDEATNTLTFKHDTNKPAGAFALNEGKNAQVGINPMTMDRIQISSRKLSSMLHLLMHVQQIATCGSMVVRTLQP